MTALKRKFLVFQASLIAALYCGAADAAAQSIYTFHSRNNFSDVAENITRSFSGLPGLASGLSYLFGILLGVLGVLKTKDHVENASQTPLKDGAIRLACGGALFSLPMVYEAMQNTIGTGAGAGTPELSAVEFHVQSQTFNVHSH